MLPLLLPVLFPEAALEVPDFFVAVPELLRVAVCFAVPLCEVDFLAPPLLTAEADDAEPVLERVVVFVPVSGFFASSFSACCVVFLVAVTITPLSFMIIHFILA